MAPISDVAIIGAGLGGLTLALSLKKQHGISSTVYEVRPDADERGTNVSLTPNALRVMQHVGVYDTIRQQGYSYEDLTLYNDHGQQLATFFHGSEQLYSFPALRINRKKVQRALLEEATSQGIQVRWGMKLDRVEENETASGKPVQLIFENGETVGTDFAIGSDGIHSRVRPAITDTKPVWGDYLGITGVLSKSKLESSIKDLRLPNMFFGRSGFMAVLPSSFDGEEVAFFSTMEFKERSRKEWEELSNNPEEIRDILKSRFVGTQWPDLVKNICRDVSAESLAAWPFYVVPALDRTFSPSGRVIIIGDAAHAITPQGGQGAAMAFEDAETLAHIMARLDFADNPQKLLAVWDKHRRDRMQQVRDFTDRNASLRDPGRGQLRQTVKEWMVWAAFQYMGPSAGSAWLFGYNAEDIVSVLRS